MKHHTFRHLGLATAGLSVIALTACGSDGDSGAASVEEFCAEIVALDEANSSAESEDFTQADLDQMRDLAGRAPAEIRGDIETIAGAMADALELGEDDLEGFFAIFFAPDVIAASEALEQFSVDECGLDPADPNDDTVELSELDAAGDAGETDGDAFVPDVSGVESPLYSDFGGAEPIDPGVASIDGLQVYLDLTYPDAEWRRTWAASGTSFGVSGSQWDVGAGDLGGEDPVVVCEAIMEYLRPLVPDDTMVLEIVDFFGGGETTPIARADAGGACVAV